MEPAPPARSRLRLLEALRHRDFKLLFAGQTISQIGDAAFVVRPHTAMGVGKAAGDVMALRKHVAAEADLETALARYQGERLPVGREIAALGRRLGATAL